MIISVILCECKTFPWAFKCFLISSQFLTFSFILELCLIQFCCKTFSVASHLSFPFAPFENFDFGADSICHDWLSVFLPSIDATNRGRDRRRAPAFRQMQLSAKLVICLNSEQCSWIQIFDSRFFDWGRNRGKVRRQVQDSRGAFCTHVYPCKSHCVTYKQRRHVG